MLWPWKSQIKIVLGPRTPPLRLIEIWCRCLAIVPRNWLLPCRFHHPSNWTQTRFSVAKTKRKKKQKNKTSGNNISCNTHVSCKQPDVRIVNDKQRPLIHGPVIRAKKKKKDMHDHTHTLTKRHVHKLFSNWAVSLKSQKSILHFKLTVFSLL